MINFTDMTGLAGSAVAIAAVVVVLPGVALIPKANRIILAGVVAGVALIPFGSLPLAAYARGAIGDLSITSLVLLLMAILRSCSAGTPLGKINMPALFKEEGRRECGKYTLLSLVAIAAFLLYPMVLGISSFDPYRMGYGDALFLGALLFVSVFAYYKQMWLSALVIPLAMLAWAVGWYESPNLWDYLLDPLLAFYAVGALAKLGAHAIWAALSRL